MSQDQGTIRINKVHIVTLFFCHGAVMCKMQTLEYTICGPCSLYGPSAIASPHIAQPGALARTQASRCSIVFVPILQWISWLEKTRCNSLQEMSSCAAILDMHCISGLVKGCLVPAGNTQCQRFLGVLRWVAVLQKAIATRPPRQMCDQFFYDIESDKHSLMPPNFLSFMRSANAFATKPCLATVFLKFGILASKSFVWPQQLTTFQTCHCPVQSCQIDLAIWMTRLPTRNSPSFSLASWNCVAATSCYIRGSTILTLGSLI